MARLDDFGGFGDFSSWHGNSPMDLTDFIAMALLKRALRSAGLHHVLAGAPCTVVLAGIPEGTANLFVDTVGKLFRRPGRDPNGIRSKVHDRTGTRVERSRSVGSVVPSLRSNWSTAWLYDSADAVPQFLREIADGVANLAIPDDRLMRAIVSKVRATQPMGRRDLDALQSLPWHLLVGFLEEGRPLRSATQLAERVEAARRREDGEPEKISDAVAAPGAVVDSPTLDDLHGLGEAVAWGRALAVDLADYKAGRIGWSEVDRGALVTGPPGTGKTTFALALGRTCGVPVHVHSLARWQAAGYLNVLLKEMRTAFSEAIANAPCILFVDELDSFGDRAVVDDHNARYTREVINSFLECLDGAEARTGVVVVGATNHPGLIDPAIRRAGRLDREIVIPLPDADARAGIVRYHLRGDLTDADLALVTEATEGKSGADIEALVRGARRCARTARRPMEIGDLLQALPPAIRLNDVAFRRVCLHEAGHVVVGQALAAVSGSVPVRAVARRELRVAGSSQTEFTVDRGGEATLASYLDLVTTMLGGMAAELEILGNASELSGGAADSDLARATRIVARSELDLGLGGTLLSAGRTSDEEIAGRLERDRPLKRRVERTLYGCLDRARTIVRERRADAEAVAACLATNGTWSATPTVERAVQAAPLVADKPVPDSHPGLKRRPSRYAVPG